MMSKAILSPDEKNYAAPPFMRDQEHDYSSQQHFYAESSNNNQSSNTSQLFPSNDHISNIFGGSNLQQVVHQQSSLSSESLNGSNSNIISTRPIVFNQNQPTNYNSQQLFDAKNSSKEQPRGQSSFLCNGNRNNVLSSSSSADSSSADESFSDSVIENVEIDEKEIKKSPPLQRRKSDSGIPIKVDKDSKKSIIADNKNEYNTTNFSNMMNMQENNQIRDPMENNRFIFSPNDLRLSTQEKISQKVWNLLKKEAEETAKEFEKKEESNFFNWCRLVKMIQKGKISDEELKNVITNPNFRKPYEEGAEENASTSVLTALHQTTAEALQRRNPSDLLPSMVTKITNNIKKNAKFFINEKNKENRNWEYKNTGFVINWHKTDEQGQGYGTIQYIARLDSRINDFISKTLKETGGTPSNVKVSLFDPNDIKYSPAMELQNIDIPYNTSFKLHDNFSTFWKANLSLKEHQSASARMMKSGGLHPTRTLLNHYSDRINVTAAGREMTIEIKLSIAIIPKEACLITDEAGEGKSTCANFVMLEDIFAYREEKRNYEEVTDAKTPVLTDEKSPWMLIVNNATNAHKLSKQLYKFKNDAFQIKLIVITNHKDLLDIPDLTAYDIMIISASVVSMDVRGEGKKRCHLQYGGKKNNENFQFRGVIFDEFDSMRTTITDGRYRERIKTRRIICIAGVKTLTANDLPMLEELSTIIFGVNLSGLSGEERCQIKKYAATSKHITEAEELIKKCPYILDNARLLMQEGAAHAVSNFKGATILNNIIQVDICGKMEVVLFLYFSFFILYYIRTVI